MCLWANFSVCNGFKRWSIPMITKTYMILSLRMSTKKESDKTTTRVSEDTSRLETTTTTATPSLSERHSVDRVLD
jgi:hypothetical protein